VNLELIDLVTGYGPGRVVTRCSFSLMGGGITAVVGPNGAGKTTLFRTILGLLPPLGGKVLIDGLRPREYVRRHGLGYLPEVLELPDHWSGAGLLARLRAAVNGVSGTQVAEAAERSAIDFDLDRPLGELSKGMRRRVGLLLALLPPPALLLLDEPEAGLDPAQRLRVRENLRTLADGGVQVIVATHDVTGIGAIADRAFLVQRGAATAVQAGDLADPARVLALFAAEEEAS